MDWHIITCSDSEAFTDDINAMSCMILNYNYTDGQKIAKRLSSSITKETKKAKELLMEYNETSSQLDICREHSPLQLQEVLPINSELWQSSPLPECMTSRSVPWHSKREIIQAFLLKQRCEEELQLLEDAMRNVLEYWSNRIAAITGEIEQLQENDDGLAQFNIGAINSLKHLLWESELQISKAVASFRNIIVVDHLLVDTAAELTGQCDLDSDSSITSESASEESEDES